MSLFLIYRIIGVLFTTALLWINTEKHVELCQKHTDTTLKYVVSVVVSVFVLYLLGIILWPWMLFVMLQKKMDKRNV